MAELVPEIQFLQAGSSFEENEEPLAEPIEMDNDGWKMQKLNMRHRRIMDFHLAGYKATEIAKLLGITDVGVRLVINQPLFQVELKKRREEIEKGIDSGMVSTVEEAKNLIAANAAKAVQVHLTVLENESATVKERQSSAEALLDRVLSKKTETAGTGTVNNILINSKDLENLNLAFIQAGLGSQLQLEKKEEKPVA